MNDWDPDLRKRQQAEKIFFKPQDDFGGGLYNELHTYASPKTGWRRWRFVLISLALFLVGVLLSFTPWSGVGTILITGAVIALLVTALIAWVL